MEGKVIGIHGPVLDLQFTDYTPFERELIKVRDILVECRALLGEGKVRTVALGPTEGIRRGDKATALGKPMTIKVGEQLIGRVLSGIGAPLDQKEEPEGEERSVFNVPPQVTAVLPVSTVLETGIKALDLLAPFPRGGKKPFWSWSSFTTSP